VRRVLAFLVRNWPLKIAAVGLATLLYAGFVVSRDSIPVDGPIPIKGLLPEDATVVQQLPSVDRIRYTAGPDVPQLSADDFEAEVDLTNVEHNVPVVVRVRVRTQIGGVFVASVEPSTINVIVEDVITSDVDVVIAVDPPPPNVQVGELAWSPKRVTVRGARSLVEKVQVVTATVAVEPSLLDIDRTVEPTPVDANGVKVPQIQMDPGVVSVQLPVIENNASKGAVPINVRWAGQPAAGYVVTGVTFDPPTVSVVGDADDLASLLAIDTQPIELGGQSAPFTRLVELAVPTGLTIPDIERVTARVTIEQEMATRTFNAGFELIGRDPALTYQLSGSQVIVTLFGPVLELDRIAQTPLLVDLDVTGLLPGSHVVGVTPRIPTALTAASTSPPSVTVTIAAAVPSGSAPPGSSAAP
jgi:YbbR domain-containing protein